MPGLDSQLISDTAVLAGFTDSRYPTARTSKAIADEFPIFVTVCIYKFMLDPELGVALTKLKTTKAQTSTGINGSQALALVTADIPIANHTIEVEGLCDHNVLKNNRLWCWSF
jgi:hypothetical protein